MTHGLYIMFALSLQVEVDTVLSDFESSDFGDMVRGVNVLR